MGLVLLIGTDWVFSLLSASGTFVGTVLGMRLMATGSKPLDILAGLPIAACVGLVVWFATNSKAFSVFAVCVTFIGYAVVRHLRAKRRTN